MFYLTYKYVVKLICFNFIHLRHFNAKIVPEKKKQKLNKNDVDFQITKTKISTIIYNRDVIWYKAAGFQFP